jgi:dipeptidyl aminopeptidase/acylaminoacyl peptidase
MTRKQHGAPTLAARRKVRPITVDDLWKIERLGLPSVSPDGRRVVAALTRHSMEDNKSASTLWLMDTAGAAPRPLTQCGEKDGAPLFSPRGDLIAFTARREQQGHKDDETQLYVIAPDGGEARRVATVATGVESFRWFPDGRRLGVVSWVWPDTKGAAAQARRHKQFKERKESGYVTSEAQYRYWDHHLPMGRVPHLHVMGTDGSRPRDLFEGTPYELSRAEPDTNTFDISPDGQRIVFVWDPAEQKRIDNHCALVELDIATTGFRVIARDADWNFGAPRYSPDGDRIAFTASQQGRRHTMPAQVALWNRAGGDWEVLDDSLDREVQVPLHWQDDGAALLFTAEERARRHLWRLDLATRRAEVVVPGGWVHAFDAAGGTLVTLADAMLHPARLHAHRAGTPARRLERFNDALLDGLDLGRCDEAVVRGAEGDEVQMWLVYPPGFDPARRWPVMHVIHGGPHTAAGDTWHYRWNNAVFAAQGYVVAAVNYHGSTSFGWRFMDSITHRFGELELRDIEAATDWLLAKPWADPARVFATGGSYGGFMVAWMNGHVPPGRYAAYVCHAGCFDWTAMFADDAYTWHAKEMGAWYWDDMAKVHGQSPHAFASGMKTPTLVVHGALDYRVPDAQGLAYYNTLKARGVDARLLWFPDENHWVLKPRNSKLWYGEFFAWLERHARVASEAPASAYTAEVVPASSGQ